jgi:hypothetical protein
LVRGAEDVLDIVFGVGVGPRPTVPKIALEPRLQEVLDAVEAGESLPAASLRSGLSPGELRGALGRLETLGLVRRDGMGGYERCLALGRRT